MPILPDPTKRSTVDLIVLGLALTVCLVIVLSTVAVAVVECINPDVDTEDEVRHVADLLSVIIGAVVGFVGGRGSAPSGHDRSPGDEPPAPDRT